MKFALDFLDKLIKTIYLPELMADLICQLLETSEESMSGYTRAGRAAERLQVNVLKATKCLQNGNLNKVLMAEEDWILVFQ